MTLTSSAALQRLAPTGSPLAGRADELATLRLAWEQAAAGRGGVILVGGEAGVGKTRLATELACEAEAAGASVLAGRCPAGGADPYQPLAEALGPIRPPAGGRDRDAMFAGLAAGLVRRAQRSPVLLVLDDLHHADRSTVLAVRRIADAVMGAAAVLVVGTYRDVAVDRSSPLADLLDHPGVAHLTVGGLAPGELGEIYDDANLAGRLWRRSGGNPVVVGELLRLPALDEVPAPGFDELVARRLDRLEPSTRRVLEGAAVTGTEFTPAVVAAATGLSLDRVRAALARAATAGFVAAGHDPAVPDAHRFVHDMVREAVEGHVDPAGRVRLHRRVARALERRADSGVGVAPALLAWHFHAGAPVGGSAPVLRYAAQAGDDAMDLLAWEEAAVHYGRALAAAPGAPAPVRADLLLALGEAQRLSGETVRARQAFLEAAAIARRSQDGARLARAALALGQVAAVWGADPVLEGLAGEARALLGQDGPGHARADRRWGRGRGGVDEEPLPAGGGPIAGTSPVLASEAFFASAELYDVLDGVVGKPAPVPAAPVAPVAPAAVVPGPSPRLRPRPRPDDGGASALLRARHTALAGPEHTAERLKTSDEMVAMAVQTGDHELEAAARGRRIVDLLELGRLDEAAVEQAAHAVVPGRLGLPAHARDVALWSAMRALIEARPADARAAADEGRAGGTEANDPDASASFLVQRWAVALEWGSPDELLTIADECDGAARASSGGAAQSWRAMAALALARGGQDELASEELRRVAGRGLGPLARDPARLHPLACVAEAAWLLGDAHVAGSVRPLLEPFAARFVVAGRGLVWEGSVARACGLAAATTGQWDDAERHLQAAAAAHRKAGAVALLARTRLEEAIVLRGRARRGDRRRAADAAHNAAELAARTGMDRLAREAAGRSTPGL